ncbi:MAG: hypothetical protein QG670_2508 [Thermoproteota archaeon]|nr:hypothetical protein [Thermoproteota archaeon]
MIAFRRLLITSLLTASLTTTIYFISALERYFIPNLPTTFAIPFIVSIICIFVYFKLIHRNEFNIGVRESVVFGLITAIIWTSLMALMYLIFSEQYYGSTSAISLLTSITMGFVIYAGGAFFCAFILPSIGLSPGKLMPSSPLNPALARKRKFLSFAVIAVISVVVLAVFPTPHIRNLDGLNQSYPFGSKTFGKYTPIYLLEGQSIQRDFARARSKYILGAMTFTTVIDVQITENLSLSLVITREYRSSATENPTNSQVLVYYNETAKVHKTSSFQQTITDDNEWLHWRMVAIAQAPLTINGSMDVYGKYQYIEWIEWWKP